MKTIEKEIISQETIKPSFPTPIHLKTYKLSILDHPIPSISISFVLFYPKCNIDRNNQPGNDDNSLADEVRLLQQLKKSLSETLTIYYPLAGRLSKDKVSVECSDEGVEFVYAQIKCALSEILRHPDSEAIRMFFPEDPPHSDMGSNNVLVIQASFLNCGGMAIAVCVSHKVADALSVIYFLRDWSGKTSLTTTRQEISPLLSASSIFPASDPLNIPELVLDKGPDVVTKRFVFSSSKLASLKKAIVADRGVAAADHNATRVQLVTALIMKSATSAASRAVAGHLKPTCLMQAVNLRERMKPPLPENTFGNVFSAFLITLMKDDDMDISFLAGKLREGIAKFNNMEALKHRGEVWASVLGQIMSEQQNLLSSNQITNLYISSSWCRFPIYQIDFGWGRPVWVGLDMAAMKDTVYLLDTPRGDGIEAWVSLKQQEMSLFELGEDILAYASLNPSALSS